MRRAVLVLLCLAPAVPALVLIARYAVDVPYLDEWEIVPLFEDLYRHRLRAGDLWAMHNEHRIFFPRLLMLLLGNASGLDTRAWMYASFALLAVAALLLFAQHRETHGARALAAFVPVPWILFDLRQAQNLLWGWQVQVALCVTAFVAGCVCMGHGAPSRRRLFGAAAAAVVSAYSFGAGLIAPWALLLPLLHRAWLHPGERPALRRRIAGWTLFSALIWAGYLFHYVRPGHRPAGGFVLSHPGVGLYGFLATLGSMACGDLRGAAAFGALFVLLCAFALRAVARRAVDETRLASALPLLAFAAGSAAMISLGRSGFGLEGIVTASRYVTATLLGAVGLWQAALAMKGPAERHVMLGGVGAFLCLLVFGSYDGVFAGAARWREQRLATVAFLRDPRAAPRVDLKDVTLRSELLGARVEVLERYRLSLFADAPP